MLLVIIDTKRHSLVQINLVFKKTKFTLLKSFFFILKHQTNKSWYFRTGLGKSLIWWESSGT